jgi:glycosyltransferase involved in cell wall biosynthesis
MDELRVSLLLPCRGVGGGVRAIMRMAKSLKARGHDVRIFAKYSRASFLDRMRARYIDAAYGETDWLIHADVPVFDYLSLSDYHFDRNELVVAMCAQTSFDLMELKEGMGIRVYHCHGSEIENWERMIAAWHLPTQKIAISSKLCRDISAETGQKCHGIVPDGVDLEEYYPSPHGHSRDAVGAGFRWSYSKDPENIIRIFQNLAKRVPETPLLSFGMGRKPGGLRDVAYARYPTVEKARGIYSRCKAWFLPSIQDGFGMPVLEAMACGCAVVATNCGGPGDIIANGQNGFLADVGNYGEIVRRIVQILEDDDLYARIAQRGFETARRYSWDAAGASMEKKLTAIRSESRLS